MRLSWMMTLAALTLLAPQPAAADCAETRPVLDAALPAPADGATSSLYLPVSPDERDLFPGIRANLAAAGLILGRFTIDRFGLSETITVLGVGMAAAALLTLLLPETRGQDLSATPTARL